MEDLHKTAFTYKSYQKNFKVEVTKYEELEEVFAELKMKQQLWGSIDDWDALVKEWMEVGRTICLDTVNGAFPYKNVSCECMAKFWIAWRELGEEQFLNRSS